MFHCKDPSSQTSARKACGHELKLQTNILYHTWIESGYHLSSNSVRNLNEPEHLKTVDAEANTEQRHIAHFWL